MEFLQDLNVQKIQASLQAWFNANVIVQDNLIQAGLVLLAMLVGWLVGPRLRRSLEIVSEKRQAMLALRKVMNRVARYSTPIVIVFFLWSCAEIGLQTGIVGDTVTRIVATLLAAWIVIRLLSGVVRNELLSRIVSILLWMTAALAAVGLFDAAVALLDSMAVEFGTMRFSLLNVLNGVVLMTILMWISLAAANMAERRIERMEGWSPSIQVLVSKLARIALIAIAFLIAINSLGIDLTSLAVFGGALGIGIGIGLQKVVSNLLSGFLLLLDKSIKPNDVIAIGGTYGWVTSLGARYASVRTRDGIEHLIPNEELIAQRVENWSHSDQIVRLRIPVGVAYDADVKQAIGLCIEAARSIERVLDDPMPRCLLRGFGDNSVDLEIRIWINDPSNGRANVTNEVLLQVWDIFKEHEIEIPFPQRDLHLRSSEVAFQKIVQGD